MMFFGNQDIKGKINPSLVVNTENDDFDVIPKPKKKLIDTVELLERMKSKPKPPQPDLEFDETAHEHEQDENMFGDFDFANEEYAAEEFQPHEDAKSKSSELQEEAEEPIQPRFIAPEIIQFRVLAKTPEGFNGLDMLKAFRIAQLEYGNLKIFERYDDNRLVDFGVLCMVDPGTFPDHDVDQFYCPGLVFFMQPALVDDAVRVFDDFLEAINIVAVELDGTLLDHEKKPLTNATIKMIRQSL